MYWLEMRGALTLGLLALAACGSLIGADFDRVARAPDGEAAATRSLSGRERSARRTWTCSHRRSRKSRVARSRGLYVYCFEDRREVLRALAPAPE